jgi:hypothetical protein
MKRYVCLSILSFLATGAWSQDLPAYTCFQTTRPLIIDGKGDDAAWQRAETASLVDVRFLSGERFHSRPTEVRMLWDDERLYVLFVATDPDVWSTLADRDDPLWNQEVVEIFFDPDGDGLNYVEIEVNPLNAIVDLLVSKALGLGGRSYFEWSPEYDTAVHVEGTLNDPSDEDQYWSMELALPWEVLRADVLDVPGDRSLPPSPGDQWRFNFYRYERLRADGKETGIEYSAWSPTGQVNFHMPERFGIVVFAPAETAAAPATWGRIKTGRAAER